MILQYVRGMIAHRPREDLIIDDIDSVITDIRALRTDGNSSIIRFSFASGLQIDSPPIEFMIDALLGFNLIAVSTDTRMRAYTQRLLDNDYLGFFGRSYPSVKLWWDENLWDEMVRRMEVNMVERIAPKINEDIEFFRLQNLSHEQILQTLRKDTEWGFMYEP